MLFAFSVNVDNPAFVDYEDEEKPVKAKRKSKQSTTEFIDKSAAVLHLIPAV